MIGGETVLVGLGIVTAGTGAVMGLRKVGAMLNAALRRQDSIDRLLTRELGNDGNGSLKSQVVKMSVQVDGVVARLETAAVRLQHLQQTVDDHIHDIELHTSDPDAHRRESGPDAGGAGPR